MSNRNTPSAMQARLSDERRAELLRSLRTYFSDSFDEPLSDFQADGLLRFFMDELGPSLYNQGVRDAAAYVQGKLEDLEGEVYIRQ